MPIDTLKASKRLKDLGFDSAQAEGLAELLSDLDVAGATKEDLDDTEERLLQRINQVDAHIDEVEKDLTERINGVEKDLRGDIDDVEKSLTEAMNQRMETLEAELKKYVMSRVGWAAGLLAVWIALLNYLMG